MCVCVCARAAGLLARRIVVSLVNGRLLLKRWCIKSPVNAGVVRKHERSARHRGFEGVVHLDRGSAGLAMPYTALKPLKSAANTNIHDFRLLFSV